jgi:hypothetical protein
VHNSVSAVMAFYKIEDSFKAPHIYFAFNLIFTIVILYRLLVLLKHEYVILKKTGSALKKKPPGGTRSTCRMQNTAAVRTTLT